ncbi:unnamed protein product [Soboliphyme baturini]|uniref:Peptidase_M13_N domain-containing protein n=1 Tax=Soboliphyme baturini TaxID=241478 RepID=A0A183J6B9_9BILA|nr:unnamed protein product [Soboliphyme baturini]
MIVSYAVCALNNTEASGINGTTLISDAEHGSGGGIDNPVQDAPNLSRYEKFVLETMNASKDPCDNFYQYACGNTVAKWRTEHRYAQRHNLKKEIELELLSNMHELIMNINNSGNASGFERKLKNFHSMCRRSLAQNASTAIGDIIRFSEKAFAQFENESSCSLMGIMNRELGVQAVYKTSVHPNEKNASENLLYINTPLSMFTWDFHRYGRRRAIHAFTEILASFPNRTSSDADMLWTAQNITDFDYFIASLPNTVQSEGLYGENKSVYFPIINLNDIRNDFGHCSVEFLSSLLEETEEQLSHRKFVILTPELYPILERRIKEFDPKEFRLYLQLVVIARLLKQERSQLSEAQATTACLRLEERLFSHMLSRLAINDGFAEAKRQGE